MASQEAFWVLRAQCGDRDALDQLLQALTPMLTRYLNRYMGSQDCAQDVAQEVLLLVSRKLKWLRDPRLVRPWVLRMASREAVRVLRKSGVTQPLTETLADRLEAPGAEQAVRQQLEHLSVKRLVDALPPAARATVWLHYVEEFTLAETAGILDVSLGTAKSRLSYGLSQLRQRLARTDTPETGHSAPQPIGVQK